MKNFNSNNFIQTTLGELVSKEKKSIISGPFGSNIGKIFFKDKGIPVIRGNNLSTGGAKFIDDGFVFITREKANELNCYAIKNDLIFTAVGTIGQVGIIDEKLKFEEYVISNKQLRVRFDNDKITPLFAYYWFSSYWIQKLILQRNVGSTVPLINLSVLKGLPITLPKSINVQNGIVDVLENIAAKIELNNRINVVLEAMVKTLYDYWFVQFDFSDENGKPYKTNGGKMVWNEELRKEIPEGWQCLRLGEVVASTGTGLNPRDNFVLGEGDNYYVTIKNIEQSRIILDNKCDKISDQSLEIINKRSDLRIGDILFTSIEPVGITYLILEKPLNWNINESVFTIRPNYKKVTSEFLYMFLSGDYMKSYTKNVSAGSIHKGVRHSSLKACKFILPKTEVINDFTNIVSPIFKNIVLIQKENQQLSELRNWLLPMLMNGQVRVK